MFDYNNNTRLTSRVFLFFLGRGSHQFLSKTSRLSSSQNSLSNDQRPRSQLESVPHKSTLTGSRVSVASISDVSYQPVRPVTRSIPASSTISRRRADLMGSHLLSTSSKASLPEEGSTMLDRLNLESLASESLVNNESMDDWKYLLSSSPMHQETAPQIASAKLSKSVSKLTDTSGLPGFLEAEKLVIAQSRLNTASSLRGGRMVSK
jgi:hypothetical protein